MIGPELRADQVRQTGGMLEGPGRPTATGASWRKRSSTLCWQGFGAKRTSTLPSWSSSATIAGKTSTRTSATAPGGPLGWRFSHAPRGGVALDVGSGHGAIAEGLARSFERVYALEGCRRRCELLVERKGLKGLDRVEVVHADAFAIPLEDASVDLVACNGTLEWVALTVPGRVGSVQRRFLAELRRVLKPEGVLYIGIENSFGRQYLRGSRGPHRSALHIAPAAPLGLSRQPRRHAKGVRVPRRGNPATGPTPTGLAATSLCSRGPVSVRSRSSARSLPTISRVLHSLIRAPGRSCASSSTPLSTGRSPHSGTGCSPTTSSSSPRRPGIST